MVSRPEPAPQSDTQQSVYSVEIKTIRDIGCFACFWGDNTGKFLRSKGQSVTDINVLLLFLQDRSLVVITRTLTQSATKLRAYWKANSEAWGSRNFQYTTKGVFQPFFLFYRPLLFFQTRHRASITWQLQAIWRWIQEAQSERLSDMWAIVLTPTQVYSCVCLSVR